MPRTRTTRTGRTQAVPAPRSAVEAWRGFLQRLRDVRVLDPACGSGNFLYLTLRRLKDLEKEVGLWGSQTLRVTLPQPEVGPECLLGIELNPYAAELARVSIWIGHIQWMLENGFAYQRDPVLRPLHNIECRDAVLAHTAEGEPIPAEWPTAEFIVGNPPFLGDRRMRGALGSAYVDQIRGTYKGRVAPGADFVCFWHERAREQIESGCSKRAGLLATNSIRGGINRRVLDRVKDSGDIFLAWSDEPWIVDGAAVRVSIVGQDDGSATDRTLDGTRVAIINSDLTGGDATVANVTVARPLPENESVAFQGTIKAGPFDIDGNAARLLLLAVGNPNGRPNSDVVVPWVNGSDLTRRPRGMFIIDFGVDMNAEAAAAYEAPFEYVKTHVRPTRKTYGADTWWRHWNPRPEMRARLHGLQRFICTPRVSKYRVFVWVPAGTLPDSATVAIARDDDYTFGVLHSKVHELWSLRLGTWLGVGNDPRYTPRSTFSTFPFPWPLNTAPDALSASQAAQAAAISNAACALVEARTNWLNPPELVELVPDVVPGLPPRLEPMNEVAAKELSTRTLTNLYNLNPTWLQHLHADLNRAVFAAYGLDERVSEDELLHHLLALNAERSTKGS